MPRALDVDRGRAPVSANLDALADAGLYGLDAPHAVGGLDAGADVAGRVVEMLAGGCLTTTFVWIQHRGVVKRLRAAGGVLAERWLPRLANGEARAGVAVGGIRPGRDPVTAVRRGDDWLLDGIVPWVTGWGLVDVLLVAAREDGDVLWFLVDAPPVVGPPVGPGPGPARDAVLVDPPPVGATHEDDAAAGPVVTTSTVMVQPVRVVACDHANSAVVNLRDHPVPASRLVTRQPYEQWQDADAAGLRTNGSLALGVATRCGRLADDDDVLAGVDDARAALDRADTAELPAARALAAALAWHAAHVLVVTTGGRGIATDAHAQRLAREAMFLQVFGSRPSIRAELLGRSRAALVGTAATHGQ